jgi:hypothetical protein
MQTIRPLTGIQVNRLRKFQQSAMTDRLNVFRQVKSDDGKGGTSTTRLPKGTSICRALTQKMTENSSGASTSMVVQADFLVPWDATISKDDVIQFNDRFYVVTHTSTRNPQINKRLYTVGV